MSIVLPMRLMLTSKQMLALESCASDNLQQYRVLLAFAASHDIAKQTLSRMGAPEQMPADAVAEAQQLHEDDSAPLLAHRRSEALHLEATSTKDELEDIFWDEVIRYSLFNLDTCKQLSAFQLPSH